jgi:glycosyltransferase involved in cell wall biosynthesis
MAPRANIATLPNAVRPRTGVNQFVSGPVHVIFLGEIGERKGTFSLIEAWAQLVDRTSGANARLTIAGDGDIERARACVSALKLSDSVNICGWLSESEVSDLLCTAQILVLPSLSEGQPMAILEAMARGLCVIATRVGGIPELVTANSGVLIEPGNAEEIADALIHVLNDPDARAQYGECALRRISEEFNIDHASRRIAELYEAVLTRRAATS